MGRKKNEIIENQEELNMEKETMNTEVNTDMEEGFNATENFDANVDGQENTEGTNKAEETAAGDDKPKYFDNEGNEISCSAFCRMKFLEENMTKREIADTYDINYRTVYGACQNLVNDAAEEKRGRSAVEATIQVNAENQPVVVTKEGKTLVAGVEVDAELEEGTLETVNRKEWVLAQIEAGMEKNEVAKQLNVSHGVIYSITKDATGLNNRTKVMITLEDGTEISRSKHIRNLYAAGVTRKDIAKQLDVAYNVVYQATKEEKSIREKYDAAIETLVKFADDIAEENKEAFQYAIDSLKEFGIVEKAEEENETTEATEEIVTE